MGSISFLEKSHSNIQNVVVVFPFTYVNPYSVVPPVAAEYLQAGILATGRNAILLDMRFEIDIREHLEKANMVCLYGHFEECSIFVKNKIHVIDEVLDQIPLNTPIVAGGSNFSDPEEAFRRYPKVDVIILDNPETCIIDLLDGDRLESVDNIAYRENGMLRKTKRVIHPLPEKIYPKRSARNPRYEYHMIGIPIDLVRAGIGCNYNCRFCHQYGKDFEGSFRKWQGRSAQSLFNEFKEIKAPMVGWVDDDMTTGMKTLDELSGLLIEHKIHKIFGGTGRIDHVNRYVEKNGKDVLKKMEKAGFVALSFGVESLNKKTLKLYRKVQSVESIEKAMRTMNKTNILLICNFIFGSPGETEDDMLDMLWFGRKWNVDSIVTNRMRLPEDSEIHQAIYDPETGNFRPGMEMITGKELERIKYTVKFGQRTPFRIVLSFLKLYRHRGMFLDPIYLFCSALETMTKHSWIEKTYIFPFMLKITKKIVVFPFVRQLFRILAILITPPVRLMNWIFELIDKYTKISTKLLPRFFLYHKEGLYKKQVARAQVHSAK